MDFHQTKWNRSTAQMQTKIPDCDFYKVFDDKNLFVLSFLGMNTTHHGKLHSQTWWFCPKCMVPWYAWTPWIVAHESNSPSQISQPLLLQQFVCDECQWAKPNGPLQIVTLLVHLDTCIDTTTYLVNFTWIFKNLAITCYPFWACQACLVS